MTAQLDVAGSRAPGGEDLSDDELIDIVDEAQHHIGVASRALAHRVGLWHYAMQCWIYRVDPETQRPYVLLQQRSASQLLHPGLFDISGRGHYRAGEREPDGVREIAEGLGIEVPFTELVPLGQRREVRVANGHVDRELCRVFLLRRDLRPEQYSPDPGEVAGLAELGATDGLALFSRTCDGVVAAGVAWDGARWCRRTVQVTRASFVARADSYYHQVFLLAALAAAGYPPSAGQSLE